MADEQEHSGNNPKKSMNPASDEGSGQSSQTWEAPKFSEDKDRINRGIGIRGGDGGHGRRRNMCRETVFQNKYGRLLSESPPLSLDYKCYQKTNKCFRCETSQMEWGNVPCGHSTWCDKCKPWAQAKADSLLKRSIPHLCIFCDVNVEALEQVHTSSTSKNAGEYIPIKEEGCNQENKELNIHDTDTQGEESCRDTVPGQGTEKDSVTRPASGDGGDNSSRGSRENVELQATAYMGDGYPMLADAYKRDERFKTVKTFKQIHNTPAPAPAPAPAPTRNIYDIGPVTPQDSKQRSKQQKKKHL